MLYICGTQYSVFACDIESNGMFSVLSPISIVNGICICHSRVAWKSVLSGGQIWTEPIDIFSQQSSFEVSRQQAVGRRPARPLSSYWPQLQVAPSGERYGGNRRPGRKQRQTTAGYMA